MANVPKKVAVIGLDCAEPHLIEQHIKEGHLPTFRKLIESGVIADNCLVPYPTVTPPNWASIATGAWPGTHGITDFHVHIPGTTPTSNNTVEAFGSDRCKAEYIWDTTDKAGKKCIVLNYPGSWPSHMKNGIVVGGRALSVGVTRDGRRGLSSRVDILGEQLITTGIYPEAVRGSFKTAEGWKNLPQKEEDPLEMEAPLNIQASEFVIAPVTWYVLIHQSSQNGYDRATLSPTKEFEKSFCTLAQGQWSPVIKTKIKMEDGEEKEGFFRCKLLELSDDGENFRLYISGIGSTSGWSSPVEVAGQIQSQEGIIGFGGGVFGLVMEWYDLTTFVELNEFYSQWLADAASFLLSNNQWDLFFMHAHSPDWAYHMLLTDMDSQDEVKRKAAWAAHLQIYQSQDKMISQIMQTCDKDTLFVMVSDHGAVADGTPFDLFDPLVKANLTVLQEKQTEKNFMAGVKESSTRFKGELAMFKSMAKQPDVKKSKCFPQRELYIYINLKGRDPEGIVEPKDYETVQQQIIDALLTWVDPKTGKRPVSLALSKQDARILGLYGDGVGDVIFALYPWFAGQHGNLLPAAEWGVGSLKGLLTFTGPGIKKGYRLERTSNLIDLVPTLCYLMDWPVPPTVDGAVLFQVFKDPDFKSKEINKLRDGLARMETALQRGERQPWDKHECA